MAAWQSAPSVRLLERGTRATSICSAELSRDGRVRGAAIHDARIAAICLEHGVSELWTADRDFGRFPSLKTRNPLVG